MCIPIPSSAQSVKATRYADDDAVIGMNNNVYGIPLSRCTFT